MNSKKRYFLISLVAIMLIASIAMMLACASSGKSEEGNYPNDNTLENSDDTIPQIEIHNTNRKIVYTVNATLTVKDFDKATKAIYDAVYENAEDKNWISSDTQYSNTTHYKSRSITLRIKTTKINDFLQQVGKIGEFDDYYLDSLDITNSYANAQAHKSALEDTLSYYEDLRSSINIGDLPLKDYYELLNEINDKITKINTELKFINDELVKYDNDIEYSTIHLKINYSSTPISAKTSFGARIKAAFKNSMVAIWETIKWIIIALIYILPFAIIIGGITIGVIFAKKKIVLWKSDKLTTDKKKIQKSKKAKQVKEKPETEKIDNKKDLE